MTVAAFMAEHLVRLGVTDAFGLPGGVVLDFLYALEAQPGLTPHLCYHEQTAGFAACGLGSATGRLGVVYATRGPGFTNLVTPIAEAYCDSVPVLFVTAHMAAERPGNMRVWTDQEIDVCSLVKGITKAVVRVTSLEEVGPAFVRACRLALTGRKGPVVLDVAARLFGCEMPAADNVGGQEADASCAADLSGLVDELAAHLRQSQRPVLLVGDGVKQAGAVALFRAFARRVGVPVLSSRFSHEVAGTGMDYFGYIGSHGIRAANFILSKADLIVGLGNRIHVPVASPSFAPVFARARLLRYDIDASEFARKIPQALDRAVDLKPLLQTAVDRTAFDVGDHALWCETCRRLAEPLRETDVNVAVAALARLLAVLPEATPVVCDVGNHEFFVSRAAVLARARNRFVYSKSFGSLGSALGKAIGACEALKHSVLCVVGDQGLQMNVQDLQYLVSRRLPVILVLVDNRTSGMIRDRELALGRPPLQVNAASGYACPDWFALARAYGLPARAFDQVVPSELEAWAAGRQGPVLLVLDIPEALPLTPVLPKGRPCQDLEPALPREVFASLDAL